MRCVVAAVCKPVARAILSLMGAQRTGWNALHVGRVAQRPVRFFGRYHDGSRTVIGGEQPFARRIDTQVGGTPTLRIDYVQELQAAVRLNSECRDRAVLCATEIWVIPADCWTEPYMSRNVLPHEIEAGVTFWGFGVCEALEGVIGVQPVQDVTLIRHAYVGAGSRNRGIGGRFTLVQKSCLICGNWRKARC